MLNTTIEIEYHLHRDHSGMHRLPPTDRTHLTPLDAHLLYRLIALSRHTRPHDRHIVRLTIDEKNSVNAPRRLSNVRKHYTGMKVFLQDREGLAMVAPMAFLQLDLVLSKAGHRLPPHMTTEVQALLLLSLAKETC
jgi:hypothetical protein